MKSIGIVMVDAIDCRWNEPTKIRLIPGDASLALHAQSNHVELTPESAWDLGTALIEWAKQKHEEQAA